MTTVLLFGASGFIGGPVRAAMAADPRITTLVCPGRDRCDLIGGTVADLVGLVGATAPDVVVNCAGRLAGTPSELMLGNAVVAAKLVEAVSAAAPGARLVRIGSAGEYGPVRHGQAVAEDDPTAPVGDYGVSHLAGTLVVRLAAEAGRVDGVVLRVFNPIGPGCGTENLLGRAAARIREARAAGADEIALGPLSAYRDFVDTRDVATAVVAAAMVPTVTHRILNVGSGRAVTARAAVGSLARAAGFTGTVTERGTGSARSAAVDYMRANTDRIGAVLGGARARPDGSTKAIWDAVG
jgi:nucleoside-diphosphate-sugar epimerase